MIIDDFYDIFNGDVDDSVDFHVASSVVRDTVDVEFHKGSGEDDGVEVVLERLDCVSKDKEVRLLK